METFKRHEGTVLHGGGSRSAGRNAPNPICYLRDTDIVRASERQHPVQRSCGDGDLSRLGLVGARSKRIADHAFCIGRSSPRGYQTWGTRWISADGAC